MGLLTLRQKSVMRFYPQVMKVTSDLMFAEWHSSSHIIGLGIRGKSPHDTKCWLYYPEDDCPFYRTTVFSHYAPKNCPAGDKKLPTLCLVRKAPSATPGGFSLLHPPSDLFRVDRLLYRKYAGRFPITHSILHTVRMRLF